MFSTYMLAKRNGGGEADIAWTERRTLLYPKLCIVVVKDGVVQR
jgi:hypothetical protein